MARSIKTLLGGRYTLTGELARGASVQRGWDRWLNRRVFIKVLASHRIANSAAKGRFIASASALVRIEHPNVEALLDYGATDEGAPYHVMAETDELATLVAEGPMSWGRAQGILLDLIAGVHALHCRRIVHRDISLHTVALIDAVARLVEFGDAEQLERDPTPEEIGVDVYGIAALGFTLLTGAAPHGRRASSLADALSSSDAPRRMRALLLRALTEPQRVDLPTLWSELSGKSRRSVGRVRLIDVAAGLAAAGMLAIGLWSSLASFEVAASPSTLPGADGAVCEHDVAEVERSVASGLVSRSPNQRDAGERAAAGAHASRGDEGSPGSPFESARAHSQVGSEVQRKHGVSVQSERFELRRGLSPASMVQRGIDLTHGRPTPEDDPRLPIVDGPLRARALFEAACARDYGKGCHMLGVQIAEGMIPDDGIGAAGHYRRGCALDYHRSCAALADLARAGQIVADADLLEAKACLLAGPSSSYCLPRY